MITHFADRRLRDFHLRGVGRRLPPQMLDAIEEILDDLDHAVSPRDMNRPGYRLHQLSGDMAGLWSVRVTGNWRIVFRFDGPDVRDVRLIDYH
ncbi:MAG: type II toxin-antitoxin system RelE/ParE family toxin [Chloroflexi bacterium]|nr:type II toxin-antitoxin system RelE/ParE family toxin [Chloroflexota bacterium]